MKKAMKWEYNDVFSLGEGGDYAKMPLDMVHRNDLTCKAKTVFAYMTSKQGGYQFSSKRIAKHFKEGYRTILSAINELVGAGYVVKQRLCDGRMHYELRENYWSLTVKEAKESLFESSYNAFKPAVRKHKKVSIAQAREAIQAEGQSPEKAADIAFEFYNACVDGGMSMNENTLSSWLVHVRNGCFA
jgi:hypothetical protein